MDAVDVVFIQFEMLPQDILDVGSCGHIFSADLLDDLQNLALDSDADIDAARCMISIGVMNVCSKSGIADVRLLRESGVAAGCSTISGVLVHSRVYACCSGS